MIEIKDEGILLEKSQREFENQAVLNPGCVEIGGIVHMLYRAVRKGNYSTIGYCQLKDNKVIYRSEKPVLYPEHEYEAQGLEDPRIVFIDGVYYIFYTAYDGTNARVAYATSSDLKSFTKHGLISPQMLYHSILTFFDASPVKDRYVYFEKESEEISGKDVNVWDKDAFIFPKKNWWKICICSQNKTMYSAHLF